MSNMHFIYQIASSIFWKLTMSKINAGGFEAGKQLHTHMTSAWQGKTKNS